MKKILLLNIGLANKGNVAFRYSTIDTIKKFSPDTEFYLVGPYYNPSNYDNIKPQPGHISIIRPILTIISIYYLFKCILITFFSRFITINISEKSKLFEFYDSDLVINLGGDNLSGEYGFAVLTPLINIIYALLLQKSVVLYGESLGYFQNPILRIFTNQILKKTKLIILREEISRKYIEKEKIIGPQVYVTADPAFLLEPSPEKRVFEILSNEDIAQIKRPLIGINLSELIWKYSTNIKEAKEENDNNMAYLIDYLINEYQAEVLLIPHVYTFNADDRIVIKRVFKKVKNKSKVNIISGEYGPQDLKGIIGLCDLFIGARMHAMIAATSMLVPTIGIAYSHKTKGIIGDMLGQSEYILDIKNLKLNDLISKVDDAWENKDKIKKELEFKIPEVKEKALLNGKLVKELL